MTEQPKSETLKKWDERRGNTDAKGTPNGETINVAVTADFGYSALLSDADLAVLRAALPIIERLVGR